MVDFNVRKDELYDTVNLLQKQLSGWYNAYYQKRLASTGKFKQSVMTAAQMIQEICTINSHYAFGCTQLSTESQYPVKHTIQTAILAEITAANMYLDKADRLSLICACLTMNLTMAQLQEVLYYQEEPPLKRQNEMIVNHTIECEKFLKKLDIDDELWLETIRSHHENLDGAGYPDKLEGDEIIKTARIINIVDKYLSGISARSYRPALAPQYVIKTLYDKYKRTTDLGTVIALMKAACIYPAGTYVKLRNGEIGIIAYYCEHEIFAPIVYVIQRKSGAVTHVPVRRDHIHIREVIPHDNLDVGLDPYKIWKYDNFDSTKTCRRKVKRVKTTIDATFLDKNTLYSFNGKIINLSEGGCLAQIDKAEVKNVVKHASYTMVLNVMNKTLSDIHCAVKHLKETKEAYIAGIAFLEISLNDHSLIRVYIDKMELKNYSALLECSDFLKKIGYQ